MSSIKTYDNTTQLHQDNHCLPATISSIRNCAINPNSENIQPVTIDKLTTYFPLSGINDGSLRLCNNRTRQLFGVQLEVTSLLLEAERRKLAVLQKELQLALDDGGSIERAKEQLRHELILAISRIQVQYELLEKEYQHHAIGRLRYSKTRIGKDGVTTKVQTNANGRTLSVFQKHQHTKRLQNIETLMYLQSDNREVNDSHEMWCVLISFFCAAVVIIVFIQSAVFLVNKLKSKHQQEPREETDTADL